MTSKRFYLTTAIDYVNSLPHVGTAYEKIGADVLARFLRMEGHTVHFQMGNDEHSVNVKKEADRVGLAPKTYCDEMRKKFEAIWRSLGISYDGFIQTSEPRHHEAVKKFLSLLNPEDLFLAPYKGWYCESCENFLTEKDLTDGLCPNHKQKPQWLEETNYFFRLSHYQDRLLAHYKRHPEFVLPEIRRNEIVNVVRSGLQDISISRASFPWGIPFPNDPSHVVYVWFDALINYITAVGFPGERARFQRWWPAHLHVIGKDITRFHCIIWPAMLMSAGLPLPRTVFGHGFVFLKGEKMSKTLGNIVTPLDIVPRYGPDALRYYLLRTSGFGSDGNFGWDDFIQRYNSDLANDLGNLLNRTLGMVNKYLGGRVPAGAKIRNAGARDRETTALKSTVLGVLKRVREALDWKRSGEISFHEALAAIWQAVGATDKYIDAQAPWRLDREGKKREIEATLSHAVDSIRNIAILIAPFLPAASREIWSQLGLDKKLKWDRQRFVQIRWGATPALEVTLGRPVFPRIEREPVDEVPKERIMAQGNEIDIAEFARLDLKVAEIREAHRIEGTDKLLKLQVDLGGELRQLVAGIAAHYRPEELVGKKIVVVANLKPAKIRGVESRGMLLAASNDQTLSIVTLDRPIAAGAKVK